MSNRKERRAKGEKNKVKTYVLNEAQIEQIKRDAVNEAIEKAFTLMLCIPVLALHDKFGFRRIRLNRFLDAVFTWYKAVQDGEVKLTEIIDVLKTETDYDIVGEIKELRK